MTEVDFIPRQFLIVSETEPTPFEGLIWYNPATGLWKQYKSGQWHIIIPLIVSDNEPPEVIEGLIWYNPVTKKLQAWDGEAFEEIIKKPDLLPIIAQLTELTFKQDVEYFLDKEDLDYAEIWFFDGSESFDLNNLNIDTVNKQAKSYFLLSEFQSSWDGWSHGGDVKVGSDYVYAETGYSGYIQRNIDLTNYDRLIVRGSLSHGQNPQGSSGIKVLINGTEVAKKTISGSWASWSGNLIVDVSSYTGVNTVKVELWCAANIAGYSSKIYRVMTSKYPCNVIKTLSNDKVSDVMIILKDDDATKLGGDIKVFVKDDENSIEITQNKTLVNVNLNKLIVEVQLNYANPVFLNNFAILWRES